MPTSGDEDADDDSPIDGVVISPDAYSQGEVLRHREFDRMTPAELREAERLVDLLVPRLERRRTRRYELHSHGRRLAPRAMFRRNLGTGGQLVEWVWRRPIREPRSLVVICDISGSMERHSRLLLRFVQALAAASEVRTESFVFGTRLTRVTRLLRDRDRDRALARVSDAVNDWAGGTRIGESFRTFNQHWARRTLRTSGVVIVVVRRLGPRRPRAGRDRDRPTPAQLPPAGLAQPARGDARLPAAGRRDARGVPVHRRLPGRRHRRQPRTTRGDPRRCPGRRHPAGQRGRGARGTPRADRPVREGPTIRRRRHADRSIDSEATPMRELLDTLATWQADGAAIGRAVVVRTFGSAPRPEGAVLLYAADGRIAGSVSGGCVEGAAAEEIDAGSRVRARARDPLRHQRRAGLGRGAGLRRDHRRPRGAGRAGHGRRGGTRRRSAPRGTARPSSRRSPPTRRRPRSARTSPAPARRRSRSWSSTTTDGSTGRSATPALDAQLIADGGAALKRGLSRTVELGDRSYFVEVFPVRPRLVVVGAVEVARSLVRLARELGFETVVIDGRASFATAERFPDVDRLIVGWPDEVADEIGLGPNDAVAVLTHDVKFDEPAIVEALRRGLPVRRRGRVEEDAGRSPRTPAARRASARRPWPSSAGRSGSTWAAARRRRPRLAILAEIVAERYGGSGVPLRQRAVA